MNSFSKPVKLANPEDHVHHEVPIYADVDTGITLNQPHIWSFDSTLAQVLDIGLTKMMNHEYTYNLEGMERARDIFRAYAVRWDCVGLPRVEEKDSKENADLVWALDWLGKNFTALWT